MRVVSGRCHVVRFTGPTTIAYVVVSTHATIAEGQAAFASMWWGASDAERLALGIVSDDPAAKLPMVRA